MVTHTFEKLKLSGGDLNHDSLMKTKVIHLLCVLVLGVTRLRGLSSEERTALKERLWAPLWWYFSNYTESLTRFSDMAIFFSSFYFHL